MNTKYQSGIYKIKCNTCHRSYIGQIKRSLKLRYQEHIRYVKNNNPQSAYALHILNNRHEYGPMYIQSHHHHKQLIREQNSGEYNPMYQLVYDQQVTLHPSEPPELYPQPQSPINQSAHN
jgi:hypothetical protein